MSVTLHLVCNAHIDPVWLWDWREGLNEGISTCRAMVALLDEFPETTFIRGESAIYQYIERHDPALFESICGLVDAGRWDVVGGTLVQPDHNLPCTEVLLRQFVRGKEWFRQKLDREVTVAWATDAFGHSAGLPDILNAAGIDAFACTRPWDHHFPVSKSAFWWRGAGGARVLSYRPRHGWYGSNRDETTRRLDEALAEAGATGLENVACFLGLGNHGGGTSRRMLREVRTWQAAHPDVKVVYSGLHRFFAALRAEARGKTVDFLPEVVGELNFCLRGCSTSMARFKFAYRRAQSTLLSAERTHAAVMAFAGSGPASLETAWDTLLFNTFHDILPGSSIERAYDDQFAQIGGCIDAAQRHAAAALMDLSAKIDTTTTPWLDGDDQPLPVPVLVWNPHPWSLRRQVEVEVNLDYRPLFDYRGSPDTVPVAVKDHEGTPVPHQLIAVENDCDPDLPWRKRVVVSLDLPPMGWRVLHMGLNGRRPAQKKAPGGRGRARMIGSHAISNGTLCVSAPPGQTKVSFRYRNQAWLPDGLQVRLYADDWGSWGGMAEEGDSWLLTRELERWAVTMTQVLEDGPERAALWVRFSGTRSRLDLTFRLGAGTSHVEVDARAFINERATRLKLVLPAGGDADFLVPGGEVRRKPCGQVPGGRWVRAGMGVNQVGFASNALYGFETTVEEFRVSIARSTRYASEVRRHADETPWFPVMDQGELRFRFLLTPDHDGLEKLAAVLEEPPVAMPVPARPAKGPARGSIMELLSNECEWLALRWMTRGEFELRLRNTGAARALAVRWLNVRLSLGRVAAGEIATWRISKKAGIWRAVRARAI
jgi:alpha-mannosidase